MIGWSDGDIVNMHLPDGRDVYRIILKAHDKYATTVSLYDAEALENEYKVKPEKVVKHADLGKIAFTKSYDLDSAEFVRAMEEKEFERFKSRIGEVLGIPTISVPEEEPFAEERAALRNEVEVLTSENKRLADQVKTAGDADETVSTLRIQLEQTLAELEKAKASNAQAQVMRETAMNSEAEKAALSVKCARAEAERDVYKDLYMQMLAKMDMGHNGKHHNRDTVSYKPKATKASWGRGSRKEQTDFEELQA